MGNDHILSLRTGDAVVDVAFDCFKTTSNAAEQENSRFKARGIRSMNILDMLDAIVDLIYEVIY